MISDDYTTRLIISRVIRDRLEESDKKLREGARAKYRFAGQRDVGIIPDGSDDGVQIGHVSLAKGAQRIRVYDQAAYMRWVEAEHPEAITSTVPSTWTQGHLKALRETGELPPGLEVVDGYPSLIVKPSEDAAEVIAKAFADGRLLWQDVAMAAVEGAP